jgi:pimeloyl-ACP methyl ester carboxylesterase
LICLPGWPQTWYSFHGIAPELSKKYRVIVVDIRGMGTSDKPKSGYDKKTMAKDIFELTQKLGLKKINLIGHDIGGMVATAFAYNYPEMTQKLILMDGDHPDEGILRMPLIPAAGTFEEKMDANYPYCWWMSFNQVKGLPEKLLAGRYRYLLDWLFHYVMIDDRKMSTFDRELYAYHYNNSENIRAGNAWYQTFTQDVEDAKNYKKLSMPVLGIGSYVSYKYLQMSLPKIAAKSSVIGITDSGHYMNEEKPDKVINAVTQFLQSN